MAGEAPGHDDDHGPLGHRGVVLWQAFVSRTVRRQRLIQEKVRSTAHLRRRITKVVCPASLATISTVSLSCSVAHVTSWPA